MVMDILLVFSYKRDGDTFLLRPIGGETMRVCKEMMKLKADIVDFSVDAHKNPLNVHIRRG